VRFQGGIAHYNSRVTERHCPYCHALMRAGTCLICAATVALVPIHAHGSAGHPSVVMTNVYSTASITPVLGRPGVENIISGDEQPHDHREFDANPVPKAEYGVIGGSASAASFSSVPGKAVPGLMTPGSP